MTTGFDEWFSQEMVVVVRAKDLRAIRHINDLDMNAIKKGK